MKFFKIAENIFIFKFFFSEKQIKRLRTAAKFYFVVDWNLFVKTMQNLGDLEI